MVDRVVISIFIVTLVIIIIAISYARKFDSVVDTFSHMCLYIENIEYMFDKIFLYIQTKDDNYLELAKKQMSVIKGQISWDNTDTRSEVRHIPTEQTRSLQDIMKSIDFTKSESDSYTDIKKSIYELTTDLSRAINTIKGNKLTSEQISEYADDTEGILFIVNENTDEDHDTVDARKIVFTPEFASLQYKTYNDFFKLKARIINRKIKGIQSLVYILYMLCIILLLLNVYRFIKKRTLFTKIELLLVIVVIYIIYNSNVQKHLLFKERVITSFIQDSSSQLTFTARMYALYKDKKYFNDYWDVVDIRNGNKNWKIYSDLYGFPDDKIDLKTLLVNIGARKTHVDKLNRAKQESDALIWSELTSMNWSNNRWDEDNRTKKLFIHLEDKQYLKFTGVYAETDTKTETETKTEPEPDTKTDTKTETETETDTETETETETETGIKPTDPSQEAIDILFNTEYNINVNRIKYYTRDATDSMDVVITQDSNIINTKIIISILIYSLTLISDVVSNR